MIKPEIKLKMRTEVGIDVKSYPKLGANAVVCGIGSCFSENLVGFMHECGFSGTQNPTGILYNTDSMSTTVNFAVSGKRFIPDDFFEYNGRWHSWEHHGAFSAAEPGAAADKANVAMRQFAHELKRADMLILTPSSSVVYVEKNTERIVANCHKAPNNNFETMILNSAENTLNLENMVLAVHGFNPDCRIIITLSPVRHYPGDLQLNARSKANLLSGIRECVELHREYCDYFPAYEIMNDELRDYRFYRDDLLHPTEQAIGYILGRFIETCCDATARDKVAAAVKAHRMAEHRSIEK